MEAITDNVDYGSDTKPPVVYRCKKCRRIVASEESVAPHKRGEGIKSFKWNKRNENDAEVPECSSIFVEPMKWMQALEEGCVGDILQCIGCKARLGAFNWAGTKFFVVCEQRKKCSFIQLSNYKEIVSAHPGSVNSLQVDLIEGRYILSGASDTTVAVYDIQRATGHEGGGVISKHDSLFVVNKQHDHAHKYAVSSAI